jgi:hypothetical protein
LNPQQFQSIFTLILSTRPGNHRLPDFLFPSLYSLPRRVHRFSGGFCLGGDGGAVCVGRRGVSMILVSGLPAISVSAGRIGKGSRKTAMG